MKLTNFTGTLLYHLKKAIHDNEKLPSAASQLKLWVEKPEERKKDLDQLEKTFTTGKSFDFTRLIKEYDLDNDNPITVELPGK